MSSMLAQSSVIGVVHSELSNHRRPNIGKKDSPEHWVVWVALQLSVAVVVLEPGYE